MGSGETLRRSDSQMLKRNYGPDSGNIRIRFLFTPYVYLAPFWRNAQLLQMDRQADTVVIAIGDSHSTLFPEANQLTKYKFP